MTLVKLARSPRSEHTENTERKEAEGSVFSVLNFSLCPLCLIFPLALACLLAAAGFGETQKAPPQLSSEKLLEQRPLSQLPRPPLPAARSRLRRR